MYKRLFRRMDKLENNGRKVTKKSYKSYQKINHHQQKNCILTGALGELIL